MAEQSKSNLEKALDRFSGIGSAVIHGKAQDRSSEDILAADFARLKMSIIRPVLEMVGKLLTERGHEIDISEEPGGALSIHIVPAGVNKSIHPYGWFPTLTFFAATFTKTIGLHGRNIRRNSESASGPRGDYKPAQIDSAFVERELMKFIGEIANW